MNYEPLLSHEFDLSDMEVGDSFLGCKYCWFQWPKNTAATPKCPECSEPLWVLKLTEDNLKQAMPS